MGRAAKMIAKSPTTITTAAVIMIMIAAAAAAGGGGAPGEEGQGRLVVGTEEGKVAGFKDVSTKGISFYSFLGIPYAKPPVGELRWEDPQPAEAWQGVWDGAKPGPLCSQMPISEFKIRQWEYRGEEDCLYLNVYTPQPRESGKDEGLHVMVYIHGGGFIAGGLNFYKPNVIMNEDVVLVIMQYRLGVLGFLSTEDSVMPGNYGLKDQTEALRWVQRNIHHFGGDPAKVTVFGMSAGGASTHFHLLSPHSHDLFQRAIMMSGTMFSPWSKGGAFGDVARHTASLFSCPEPGRGSGGAARQEASRAFQRCLQNVDAKNITMTLVDHVSLFFNPLLVGPRVDGDYLPAEPELLMAEGRHKHCDVMSGVTADEGGLMMLPLYTNEEVQRDMVERFAEMVPGSLDLGSRDAAAIPIATKIFQHYVGGVKVGKEHADNLCQLYGDRHITVPHEQTSSLFARHIGPDHHIYLYSLDHRGQRGYIDFFETGGVGSEWVSHADDLFYFFGIENNYFGPLERQEDLKLRDIFLKVFVNFAVTGNPTPDDSLGFTWSPAAANDLKHLSLTPTPAMKEDTRKEVRAFWESLPTRENFLLHPDKVVPVKDSGDLGAGAGVKKLRKHRLKDEL